MGPYLFGYYGGLSLSGTVFTDWNGSGDHESGEEGIASVPVYLYRDLDGDGVLDAGEPLLSSTTTDASGNYQFTNLVGNGTEYRGGGQPSLPSGYVQTADYDVTTGLPRQRVTTPVTATARRSLGGHRLPAARLCGHRRHGVERCRRRRRAGCQRVGHQRRAGQAVPGPGWRRRARPRGCPGQEPRPRSATTSSTATSTSAATGSIGTRRRLHQPDGRQRHRRRAGHQRQRHHRRATTTALSSAIPSSTAGWT